MPCMVWGWAAQPISAQHGRGGGHGGLPVLVETRPLDLAHGVAALAIGGGVARRRAPGGELGGALLLQAEHDGGVEAVAVNGVHGGALGAEELLQAGLERAQLGDAHAGIVGGDRNGPFVVPAHAAQSVGVEQVGALVAAREQPGEGRQGLPLLIALVVRLGQGQPRIDLQLLVLEGVGPGDGLGGQIGAGGPPGVGRRQGQSFDDVITGGHDAVPSGEAPGPRALSATSSRDESACEAQARSLAPSGWRPASRHWMYRPRST